MRIIEIKHEKEKTYEKYEIPELLPNSYDDKPQKSTFYNFGEEQDVKIVHDHTGMCSKFADELFKNFFEEEQNTKIRHDHTDMHSEFENKLSKVKKR